MNKLNIAATGYPGTTESWKFVKNAYEMIADLVGKMVDPTTPVIITGMKQPTGTDIEDGYLAYKGELYKFNGGSVTDTVCIFEDKTQANYNTDISNQGQLQLLDTYFERYAKCGASGDGVDEFLLADAKRIESILTIASLTNQATESDRGTAKIVKVDDVTAGTDDEKILTIKKLVENRQASDAKNGLVRLALLEEIITGTNTQKAITPKKLRDAYYPGTVAITSVNQSTIETVAIPDQGGSNYLVLGTIKRNNLYRYIFTIVEKNNDNFKVEIVIYDSSSGMEIDIDFDFIIIKI